MARDSMRRRVADLAKAPDVEAEALSALARFRQGRRLTGAGKLPATGEAFAWRLLNGTEEDEAVSSAVRRLADLGLPTELRAYEDLEEALTWELLALAMRDPKPATARNGEPLPSAFAKDSFELRDLLSATEREILAADYDDFAASVDPDPIEVDPEVLLAIDAAVKKKQVANLIAFGSRALVSYMLTTDSQPSTSQIGKSESGS